MNIAKMTIKLDKDIDLDEYQITMQTDGDEKSLVEMLKRIMLSHEGFRKVFNEAAREATKERQKNQN